MAQSSPNRESLFSTFTKFVIWQTGPNCISKKLATEILSQRDQFDINWLDRQVLRVASQRVDPNYFIKPEPSKVGEVDSIAKLVIEARQKLIELGHQIGEVDDSIAGYAIQLAQLISPRTPTHKHA
jgi:hypothetical protein